MGSGLRRTSEYSFAASPFRVREPGGSPVVVMGTWGNRFCSLRLYVAATKVGHVRDRSAYCLSERSDMSTSGHMCWCYQSKVCLAAVRSCRGPIQRSGQSVTGQPGSQSKVELVSSRMLAAASASSSYMTAAALMVCGSWSASELGMEPCILPSPVSAEPCDG